MMKGFSKGFHSLTHFEISIILLCAFLIISLPVNSSPTLTISETAHVWGGDISLEDHYYLGVNDIPVVHSQHGFGLIYYDYAPVDGGEGLFLALVNKNAKLTVDPIRLTDDGWSHSGIFWNGAQYICMIGRDNGICLKRVSVDGFINSELDLTISGAHHGYFNATIDNDVLRVIRRDGDNEAECIYFSLDGTALTDPVRVSLLGELESAVFLDNGFAALSRRERSGSSPRMCYLEIFDMSGNRVGSQTNINGLSRAPSRTLSRNADNLVFITGKENALGRISMHSFCFDSQGEQKGDSVEIFDVPPEGYHGKINFISELIPVENGYLAVWDHGASDRLENIWARLLDANGAPISEPIKINSEPLNQANHATIRTDTGFAVFSVEKGNKNPSIDYTHIAIN